MKKYLKSSLIIMLLSLTLITFSGCTKSKEDNKNLKIVTSFYPIYIMAQNITDGIESIELTNMTDINVGCLHDYTLQPADLKKIEKADIFIENGLGIENFNDKIINSYKNLEIINSTENINALEDDNELNGHTWTSISNYIEQVDHITIKLKEKNPENRDLYEKNAGKYKKKLLELKKIIQTMKKVPFQQKN